MQKDVLVVDENNVIYGGTYPKRAKELVKKGRARFIDEHTICMTRPPEQTEDRTMSTSSHSRQRVCAFRLFGVFNVE